MATGDPPAANEPSSDRKSSVDEQIGHPVGRSLSQLEASQDAMRSTTKWLVGAAASVGVVLVAGLSLSDLPSGRGQLLLAMGGFVLALLGVANIIFAAARVLVAGFTSLGQLADLRDDHYATELRKQQLHGAVVGRWQKHRRQAAAKAKSAKVLRKPMYRAE